MSGIDLGTWYVRVVLTDGRGFITKLTTGSRFIPGIPWDGETVGLAAKRQPPVWENEDALLSSIEWQYTKGNYGCDCSLLLFLDAVAMNERDEHPCGDSLKIATLDAIRPDGTVVRLIGQGEPESYK